MHRAAHKLASPHSNPAEEPARAFFAAEATTLESKLYHLGRLHPHIQKHVQALVQWTKSPNDRTRATFSLREELRIRVDAAKKLIGEDFQASLKRAAELTGQPISNLEGNAREEAAKLRLWVDKAEQRLQQFAVVDEKVLAYLRACAALSNDHWRRGKLENAALKPNFFAAHPYHRNSYLRSAALELLGSGPTGAAELAQLLGGDLLLATQDLMRQRQEQEDVLAVYEKNRSARVDEVAKQLTTDVEFPAPLGLDQVSYFSLITRFLPEGPPAAHWAQLCDAMEMYFIARANQVLGLN